MRKHCKYDESIEPKSINTTHGATRRQIVKQIEYSKI